MVSLGVRMSNSGLAIMARSAQGAAMTESNDSSLRQLIQFQSCVARGGRHEIQFGRPKARTNGMVLMEVPLDGLIVVDSAYKVGRPWRITSAE